MTQRKNVTFKTYFHKYQCTFELIGVQHKHLSCPAVTFKLFYSRKSALSSKLAVQQIHGYQIKSFATRLPAGRLIALALYLSYTQYRMDGASCFCITRLMKKKKGSRFIKSVLKKQT